MCELFAVAPATFARVLVNAEKALSCALKTMPDASIRWPTFAQQTCWAQATEAREQLVTGVFAFVDGKNLPVREPSSSDLQNAHYNGWLHSVFVTGLQAMSDSITSLRQAAEWGMGAAVKVTAN
ncbi:hypothetical protein H257_17222 [Aphanomyces astaci]|uniref:Uncharacterized protein n=1 Tax=Aphanomyces astaci TaxID=112090 RepID=W4FFL9_APHAT|nr:hypothetical protein H257_17222 [Aphanomyces astaci]ETV66240.1 hypothetical protein H257_17222 [Aphanomyces astaci]|eukprot:XP_009844227.1 hypothetical protein H257_17222 [Aphanomyces astaci]